MKASQLTVLAMRTGLGASIRREEEEVMKTMSTGDKGVVAMQVATIELLVNTKKTTWTMISQKSKWRI